MTRWSFAALLGLGLLTLAHPISAPAADDAQLQKQLRAAFKPLRLPKASKLAKQLASSLPGGIVIESGPFDRLIAKLQRPYAEQLALRDEALEGFAAAPSVKSANMIRTGFAVLAKENAGLAKRISGVEETYAEVFNQGYMESGEKQRRARKLSAVLIPFYRTLLLRNAETVRRAGAAFAAMNEGENLEWLVGAAGDASPAVRSAAVEALSRVGGPEPQQTLRNVLVTDADPAVRSAALVGLMRWKTRDVKDAVIAALKDGAWEVRALGIAICVQAGLVEATGPLIDALGQEDGRLRQDIDDALHALVGVRMYGDVALWKTWWQGNREQVAARAKKLAADGAYDTPLGPIESWTRSEDAADTTDEKVKGATAAFYGIATLSKRILFIVDISRSMQDPAAQVPPTTGQAKSDYPEPTGKQKVDIARWQLHRAVEALPEDATFDIVVYSESYKRWRDELSPAKKKVKSKAQRFIDDVVANGVTNISDAMDKSFELAGAVPVGAGGKSARTDLAIDTVFLLSDGNPNRGRICDLEALLADIERRNRMTRIVVHTIGIGEAAGSSFLKQLAERTGGRYVGFE